MAIDFKVGKARTLTVHRLCGDSLNDNVISMENKELFVMNFSMPASGEVIFYDPVSSTYTEPSNDQRLFSLSLYHGFTRSVDAHAGIQESTPVFLIASTRNKRRNGCLFDVMLFVTIVIC